MPLPSVDDDVDHEPNSDATPRGAVIADAASRANGVLTGICMAAASTLAVAVWFTVMPGRPKATAAALLALLPWSSSSAGHVPSQIAARQWCWCGAAAALCAGVARYVLHAPHGSIAPLIWGSVVLVGFWRCGAGGGPLVPVTRFTPLVRMVAEWFELAAVVFALPMAAWVGGTSTGYACDEIPDPRQPTRRGDGCCPADRYVVERADSAGDRTTLGGPCTGPAGWDARTGTGDAAEQCSRPRHRCRYSRRRQAGPRICDAQHRQGMAVLHGEWCTCCRDRHRREPSPRLPVVSGGDYIMGRRWPYWDCDAHGTIVASLISAVPGRPMPAPMPPAPAFPPPAGAPPATGAPLPAGQFPARTGTRRSWSFAVDPLVRSAVGRAGGTGRRAVLGISQASGPDNPVVPSCLARHPGRCRGCRTARHVDLHPAVVPRLRAGVAGTRDAEMRRARRARSRPLARATCTRPTCAKVTT